MATCSKTGLPYSFDELSWRRYIFRPWTRWAKCPYCDEVIELHGSYGCGLSDLRPMWVINWGDDIEKTS